MPVRLALSTLPLTANLAAAWVVKLWSAVANTIRPRVPPENFSRTSCSVPGGDTRGKALSITPIRISDLIRSSMPSGPAVLFGPMRSSPLKMSDFSTLMLACRSKTFRTCRLMSPLARVRFAALANCMSMLLPLPSATMTPARVDWVRLISTDSVWPRKSTPSTPTSAASTSVPLTANLLAACTARL